MGTFELYRDKGDHYRWRLRSGNHRTIADGGEGYSQKDDALHGIELVRVQDGEFEVYQDAGGGHRWRLRAANGRIFADSGEGYASRSNCTRAIRSVKRVAPVAQLDDKA